MIEQLGTLIRVFVALATLGGFAIAGVAVVYALMKVRRQLTGSTEGWATQVLDAFNAGTIAS